MHTTRTLLVALAATAVTLTALAAPAHADTGQLLNSVLSLPVALTKSIGL
ncbi:hypothetical protein SMC26_23210 [Actinomadura fulvescens]|uniref:Secreted protein n=1 Tax=Actinomadura fulvescens TaxID=46160 RepID=A0ABP6DAA3_9ACTN